MSNVRVDIGRILSPPWNGLGAFAYMDILNCSSGDFIWQPESDRSCQRPAGIGRQHAISRPDTEPLRERRLIGTLSAGVGRSATVEPDLELPDHRRAQNGPVADVRIAGNGKKQ